MSRYWNFLSTRRDFESQYFSKQLGFGVVEFLNLAVPLAGKSVLDYGCGPGFLGGPLMARGAQVFGIDSSESSVIKANRRFEGVRGWGGAQVKGVEAASHGDSEFDVICCVETIEHLLPDDLTPVLLDVLRLLKPGGTALFTTPNNEDLGLSMNYCPNCGVEYHQWQHVRNWTGETLRSVLRECGFEVVECVDLDFGDFQPKKRIPVTNMGLRGAASLTLEVFRRVLDQLDTGSFPHLRALKRRFGDGSAPHLAAVVRRPS